MTSLWGVHTAGWLFTQVTLLLLGEQFSQRLGNSLSSSYVHVCLLVVLLVPECVCVS